MARTVSLLVAIFLFSEATLASDPISASEPLVNYVKEQTYPQTLPHIGAGNKLAVYMETGVFSVRSVDREKNQVDLTVWVGLNWDSGIKWHPSDFQGQTKCILPAAKVWAPHLTVSNAVTSPTSLTHPNVLFTDDGVARVTHHYRLLLACDVSQDGCHVNFANFAQTNDFVVLEDVGKGEGRPSNEFLFRSWVNKGARFQARGGEYHKHVLDFEGFEEKFDTITYKFSIQDTHAHIRRGPSSVVFRWD